MKTLLIAGVLFCFCGMVRQSFGQSPAFMGSPYVPLESWIYPALERLSAMGYVKTAILGLRPWTRLECARLVSEASETQPDTDGPPEVQQLYAELSKEFAHEFEMMTGESNSHVQLESAYQRSLGISGKPLTDNQHFGQTLLNDSGRPFQAGFNTVAGASGWATTGPFVIYGRGEYQYAPSSPALPQNAQNFIAATDILPLNPPATPITATNRFRALDAYVGVTLANWQLSFGRQSQWWGPSEGGAMLFTNNAEPLNNMFRIDRVRPFQLPWLFRYLGDIRLQFFLGQFSGHEFLNNGSGASGAVGQYGHSLHPQPILDGGKISFKLTENFEFGLTKTTVYGGPGTPLTSKTFFQSAFGIHVNGSALGDGRSGADFSYRVPKLRNWVSFYGEAMSEDQPSPIPYMRQSIFQGGLYFAKIPRITKVDLRLEGGSTSAVNYDVEPGGYFYWNGQYVDGYTNNGRTIGSWIGRAAQGESMVTNYWLSAKNKIGLQLRHRKVDRQFLPQGGTQNDVAVNADFFTRPGFGLSGSVTVRALDDSPVGCEPSIQLGRVLPVQLLAGRTHLLRELPKLRETFVPLDQLHPLYSFITQHPFQALIAYLACRGPQKLLDLLKPVVTSSYEFCGFCHMTHSDFMAGCEGRRRRPQRADSVAPQNGLGVRHLRRSERKA